MKNLSLTKKERRQRSFARLSGSLAARVLFISLLLLALPLLIHTFYMYEQEYKDKERELFSTLHLIGESRLHLIDQMVANEVKFLQIVHEQLHPDSDAGLNAVFKVWAEVFQASKVFYLQMVDDRLLCVASSADEMVGSDFSFLKPELSNRSFTFLGKVPGSNEKLFYSALTINEKNSSAPLGALVIGNPALALLKQLNAEQDTVYPINLSFISQDGIILMSSDPKLINQKPTLKPVKGIPSSYEMTNGNEDYAALLPLTKSKWNLLVDVDQNKVGQLQKEVFISRIIAFFFLVVVLGAVLVILITIQLSKPLKNLCKVIDRIGQGDQAARFKKSSLGFELNILGEHLNDMMDSVVKHQKIAQDERLQKERFEGELLIGHHIQKNLLPTDLPQIPMVDIATGYLPAKEVSGDFYDLFYKDDKLFIVIADTSGKGISACLYSLGVRSILRAYFNMSYALPEIIRLANDLFCQDVADTGIFVTAWFGILDFPTKTMTYSSAGHVPTLLHKKDGSIYQLNTDGIALGAELNQKVVTKMITIEEEDVLLLYTDGITEARNEQQEMFGLKRLGDLISVKELPPSRYLVKEILQKVKNFTNNAPQEDDSTLVIIKLKE